MNHRDFQDILGGAALIAFGAFVSFYAYTHYVVGTLNEMGPGMMPTGLGVMLVALGAIVLAPALFRAGAMPQLDWRPFLFVVLALSVFALAVERIGLIPSIYALVFIAMLGDDQRRPVSSLVLATVLNLIVIAIFVYGLGMPFKLLTWDM